jgi:hypothetical protein
MSDKCRIMLLLGFLAAVLAACSDSGPSKETASVVESNQEESLDPCALLQSDEIESALGWKVATTEPTVHGATGSCKYSSATPYTLQGMQQLAVVVGQGSPEMRSSEALVKWRLDQYSGDAYKDMKPVVETVDGLGVPAIRNGMDDLFGIEMIVGDKLVTLSPFESLEPARTLAAKVISRLQ